MHANWYLNNKFSGQHECLPSPDKRRQTVAAFRLIHFTHHINMRTSYLLIFMQTISLHSSQCCGKHDRHMPYVCSRYPRDTYKSFKLIWLSPHLSCLSMKYENLRDWTNQIIKMKNIPFYISQLHHKSQSWSSRVKTLCPATISPSIMERRPP